MDSEWRELMLKTAEVDLLRWLTRKHVVVAVFRFVLHTQGMNFWLTCTNKLQVLWNKERKKCYIFGAELKEAIWKDA